MFGQGRMTDIMRGINRLEGILQGITCDSQLTDAEIGELRSWMDLHPNLADLNPFREVRLRLRAALADGIVDPDEREELLEWCADFAMPSRYGDVTATEAVQKLHGFVSSLLYDGEISDDEIGELNDWLSCHGHLRSDWPFNELFSVVEEILFDGKVTDHERELLKSWFLQFEEIPEDRAKARIDIETARNVHCQNEAPVVRSLTYVCDPNPSIQFTGKRYCFTGLMDRANRTELLQLVAKLGGIPKNNVTLDLNYLVIGGLSSPVWIYSTYGRKLETVMAYRQKGADICILLESSFWKAVESVGAVHS